MEGVHDDVTRTIRPALLAVVGAVVLVLAIACVNVTNLLLARGARRRTEFAMRIALGAPRSRLIRQSLTESVLLAGVGGGLGLLVAFAGVRALLAVSPAGLPRAHAIAIDGTVFVFACALTTIVAMLIGVLPALTSASRARMRTAIEEASRRSAGRLQWPRRTLVAAEVGLALVLLVGAGLLLRSVQSLFAVAPGFDPAQVLTMQIQTSGLRFRDPAVTHRFFADALAAVRRVPGVSAAGLTSQLPLSGDYDKYGVHFESIPVLNPEEEQSAFRYAVSPGYFETLRIPLRRGRLFDEHDRAGARDVVVINESFARRKFGDRDPLGQRVRVGRADGPWSEIVGVVGDIKQASLAITDADAAYVPTTQWYFADNPLWLVVRGDGDVSAQATAIREAIWSVDTQQPIVRVATMESLVTASVSEQRFALILFEIFAAAALLLAAIGVFGILSGTVSERTREIGIRAALGASRRTILVLVLREGMVLTALGIAAGLIAAIAASESLVTLLFGISPLDPVTYGGVIALLLGVSGIAAVIPASRAASVDPAITLRMD